MLAVVQQVELSGRSYGSRTQLIAVLPEKRITIKKLLEVTKLSGSKPTLTITLSLDAKDGELVITNYTKGGLINSHVKLRYKTPSIIPLGRVD